MLHYKCPAGKRRALWSISMTEGNYGVARAVAWAEVRRMLEQEWNAGSFGAGLLLYMYTEDGE